MVGVNTPPPPLHTHLFGPADGPQILALHGLTGHGRRWEHLATRYLPDARFVAPDLRGHGRSPWAPPWNFETHVQDLLGVLDAHTTGPVLVVGHSFGGALAVHLAATAPDRVRGLLLLDPAIGLPPERMQEIADLTVRYPDYTDAAEARADKAHGAWGEVAEELIELETGRVNWRLFVPALVTSWSELARDFVLPTAQIPTTLVRAAKVQPPYVTAEFRAALAERLGADLTELEMDCDHMIDQARPEETATLIRGLL